jgi:hypothetical protein
MADHPKLTPAIIEEWKQYARDYKRFWVPADQKVMNKNEVLAKNLEMKA